MSTKANTKSKDGPKSTNNNNNKKDQKTKRGLIKGSTGQSADVVGNKSREAVRSNSSIGTSSEASNSSSSSSGVVVKYLRKGPLVSLDTYDSFSPKLNSYSNLSSDQIKDGRASHLSGSLKASYASPMLFVRGRKQYLFDQNGERYLDAYNNVAGVGHCHPKVVAAAVNQISEINTNTRYLHPNIILYAKRLLSKFPSPIRENGIVFFVNSGSEANDLATRLAKAYTGKSDFITVDNAYHGHTVAAVDISPTKSCFGVYGAKGSGFPEPPAYVHTAPVPDIYRGKYTGDSYSDGSLGVSYANDVQLIIDKIHKDGKGVAGFVHESIQGTGGQIFWPDNYLSLVYEHVRKAGGVCIADEVQTGFGRCGTYWGFETYNPVPIPDIITLGKPIGNGFPLGAVVTRKEISDEFTKMEYFNTFGGNPVACAVGLAVMDAVEQDKLQENAAKVGKYLLDGLVTLKEKYEKIGDVRGRGLFLGIEFVETKASKTADSKEAVRVCQQLKEKYHILTGTDGPNNNIIRIKPPLCFSLNNATYFLEALDNILSSKFEVVKHPIDDKIQASRDSKKPKSNL